MRDEQEQKALEIENKRRVAKGLEPLATLDSGDTSDSTTNSQDAAGVANSAAQEDAAVEPISDVLLMETGRILVDTITLRPNTGLASRSKGAG
jgi:carboxyl-terminal processing protease